MFTLLIVQFDLLNTDLDIVLVRLGYTALSGTAVSECIHEALSLRRKLTFLLLTADAAISTPSLIGSCS